MMKKTSFEDYVKSCNNRAALVARLRKTNPEFDRKIKEYKNRPMVVLKEGTPTHREDTGQQRFTR